MCALGVDFWPNVKFPRHSQMKYSLSFKLSFIFNYDFRITTNPNPKDDELIKVEIEPPLYFKEKKKLVVCVAPTYAYTEWQIMITGIETWLALGATKIIFPIQSISTTALLILKQYEAKGLF